MPATYLKSTDEKLSVQLENISSKINNYSDIFALSPAEVAAAGANAGYLSWTVTSHLKVDTHKKDWTLFKNILKKGEDNITANPRHRSPDLSVAPAVVAPRIVF